MRDRKNGGWMKERAGFFTADDKRREI